MGKNYLRSQEMYQLTQYVDSAEKPFDDWRHAIRMMSAKMNRDVTRSNIETAAGNCGVDINDLIKSNGRPHPFTNMMAKVDQLEKRVEELKPLQKRVEELETLFLSCEK